MDQLTGHFAVGNLYDGLQAMQEFDSKEFIVSTVMKVDAKNNKIPEHETWGNVI